MLLVINVIDLQKLNYLEKIDINEEVEIPSEYLENTDIVELSKIKTTGNITFDMNEDYLIKLNISGTMSLHDSVTYDIIPYDFAVEIEETLEKSENSNFFW